MTIGATNFPVATDARVITPHDTNDIPAPSNSDWNDCKGIYVGGTGNLTVRFRTGEATVLISTIPAGTILPIAPRHVLSTGTTATTLVALY